MLIFACTCKQSIFICKTAVAHLFNMRISHLSAVYSVFAVVFSYPGVPERLHGASCPYAMTRTEKPGCVYSNSKLSANVDKTASHRALGKQGVFFMNRIAPGTSELYIANADGSDERKLLGNSSDFDYHATFSPDGQWITFTTERNGDGNSVGVLMNLVKHQSANSTCRTYIAFDLTDQI
jgi:hypothetical protein